DLISPERKEWMYKVMQRTRVKTLLPPGLPPGSKLIHKTGDIGIMVGDAGIVECPDGTRFIISVQVERPRNDRRANLLIRNLARIVYAGFAGEGSDEAIKEAQAHAETFSTAPAVRHHRYHRHHQRRHRK